MRILPLIRSLLAQLRGNSLTRPSIWVAFGYASEIILRLGTNLILTRLLVPELFGLMAIVNVIIMGFFLMTDVGIGQALIQSKDGESKELVDTAWTLQVIRAVFISIISLFLAVPIANFYGVPEISNIMPVMAIGIFVSGFQSSVIIVASRKLWLGRMTLLKISCHLLSSIVVIIWAINSPTVWALVVGYLVNTFSFSALSHFLYRDWKPRFYWDTNKALEIFTFGKWMFLTSVLVFLAGQLDRLALGKLAPLDEVGIYGIAIIWALIPVQASQTWFARLVFPHASTYFRESDKDIHELVIYRRSFITLYIFAMGVFAGGFGYIFKFLYPENFWPAVELFQILMIGSVLRVFDESYRVFNMAAGKPVYNAVGSAASVVVFVVILWPLHFKWGTPGLALAYSISQLGTLVVAVLGAYRLQLWDFKTDVATIGAATVVALTLNHVLSGGVL